MLNGHATVLFSSPPLLTFLLCSVFLIDQY